MKKHNIDDESRQEVQSKSREMWWVPGDWHNLVEEDDLHPENTEGQVFRGWATEEGGAVVYTWGEDENGNDRENWQVPDEGETFDFYAVWEKGVRVGVYTQTGTVMELPPEELKTVFASSERVNAAMMKQSGW